MLIVTSTASAILLLSLLPSSINAAPAASGSPSPPLRHFHKPDLGSIAIPLSYKRAVSDMSLAKPSAEQVMARESARIHGKYGVKAGTGLGRRAVGAEALSNANADAIYYAGIEVGTPPRTFQVIVDTGSADLWLSSDPCTGCQATTPRYSLAASSTARNSTSPFQITYVSGQASGNLVRDVVTMGGFTLPNQTFAAATVSENIVTGEITGIMGAAWRTIANTRATPFFQQLAQSGQFDEQIISFAMSNVDEQYIQSVVPGGIMTLGGTNTSLYTGSISWVPLIDNGSYWAIPLQGLAVDSTAVTISPAAAAIDTGTSLIGGPPSDVAALYAQIPNSFRIAGADGYYAIRCNSRVTVGLTFGGVRYTIAANDFNAGYTSQPGICLGAIFAVETSDTSPGWIVGASFLKGVYSAFRFAPGPAVGFATLRTSSSTSPGVAATSGAGSGSTTGSGTSGAAGMTKVSLVGLASAVVAAAVGAGSLL